MSKNYQLKRKLIHTIIRQEKEDDHWITVIKITFYCNEEEISWINFPIRAGPFTDSNHGLYKSGKAKYYFYSKEKHNVPC